MKIIHEFGRVLDIPEKTKQWNAEAQGMPYMVLWHRNLVHFGSLALARETVKFQLNEIYGDTAKVSVVPYGRNILITVEANT